MPFEQSPLSNICICIQHVAISVILTLFLQMLPT